MFKLGLAQTGYSDTADALSIMERNAKEGAGSGVSLLAFPECFTSRSSSTLEDLFAVSEPLDGALVNGASELARSYGMWTAFGMVEKNPEGGLPFNTAVLIDDLGDVRSVYRKTHLYDAHGTYESQRFTASHTLPQTVETPFGKICVAICYDLRFCEVSRAAALSGCQLMLYLSAWYDGPHKADHWETLLRARAIENEMFVAGVCRSEPTFVGRSLVADPLGQIVAKGSPNDPCTGSESLVVCEIDETAVTKAREAMPVLEHRRPELYSPLV